MSDLATFDEGFGVGLLAGLLVLLFAVALVLLLPFVVLGIELVIVVVLTLAGVIGRLVFGKPWVVVARRDDGRTETRQIEGFRESGRVRDEWARALATGVGPPQRL